MLRFVDTHTHIDQILEKLERPLADFPAFMDECLLRTTAMQEVDSDADGGVVEHQLQLESLLTISCALESVTATRAFMEKDERVFAAFGMHPCNAKDYSPQVETDLLELMEHPKVLAWGEMGLDYCYLTSTKEQQRAVFASQLKAAASKKMPLVIHTRDAEEDTLELLKEHTPKDNKIHIHCFT